MTYDQLHRLIFPLDIGTQADILLAFRDLEDELTLKDELLAAHGIQHTPHIPVDLEYRPKAKHR